ncbi:MAG: hypothetical protein PVJ84_11445, partial [Desulfobacteraceae bacterium]
YYCPLLVPYYVTISPSLLVPYYLPDRLPRVEIIHDPSDEYKICKRGKILEEWAYFITLGESL